MGSRVSIEKERQDVGVEGVPCATVSGEQDSEEEEEEEDEGGVGNNNMNNNNNNMNNNVNNNNHGATEGAFVPSFVVSSPEYVSTGMLRGG